MSKAIKVLLVEDTPDDAELTIRALKRAGYAPEWERVDSPSAMRKALEREWDVILSDHEMPRFSAPDALRLLKETGKDIPFIILSGAITVELAGEVMREGARDFIPKNRLALLGPAIARELEEFHTRRANIQAAEALRESELQMRTIFESALDGILVADIETRRFLAGNSAICRMLGYSLEELQNLSIGDIHPKESLPHVLEQFRKQSIGKITIAEDLPVKRKDGTIFYANINASPMKLGGRDYMVGFFRDITERKKAEEVVKAIIEGTSSVVGQEFFNALVKSLAGALGFDIGFIAEYKEGHRAKIISLWDRSGYQETFEYDLKGTPCDLVVKGGLYFHPSDVANLFPEDTWLRENKIQAYHAIRLEGAEGNILGHMGVMHRKPMNKDAADINILKIFSARASAELMRIQSEAERNRLAVGIEQAGEAIVITDTDGNIIYVNPEFEKNTGYTKEEVIGKNPSIWKSGKQNEAFYKNLWAVITAGKVWKGRFINRKKDGSLFDEEATISPVFDGKRKIINYVAVKRDITETAMLERARKHFTTITSHELKTPQVKLQLGIERLKLLKQGEFDREKLAETLKAIEDTEHDFDHIITGALLLAKLSEPVTSNMMEENYIFSHIESAVHKTRALMEKEKRDVEIELDLSRFPVRTGVYGNRRMISRAIEEILSNAVKYTPDGKKVTVTARAEEKKAVILIADEGPGVPEAKKQAALDAYSSLENTLHHSTGRYLYEGGGLGLGLTLTRLIMDHHHGRMEICSGGSQPGTMVVLSFPTIGEKSSGKD